MAKFSMSKVAPWLRVKVNAFVNLACWGHRLNPRMRSLEADHSLYVEFYNGVGVVGPFRKE